MTNLKMPHDHNLDLMAKTKPTLAYKGDIPFEEWQKTAKNKLIKLLGLEKFTRCEPLFTVESETEEEAFINVRFTFQSEEGYFVPCHFCYPKDSGGKKLPVVVCVQGHSKGMHISLGHIKYDSDENSINETDHAYGRQAVENGYCALVLEQRNFGECGGKPEPDCYNSTMAALLIGRTTAAERVWDIMRAIDLLSNFPQADTEKIALTGNSGGGTSTFYAACIDERISLAMPSCAVCTYDASIAAIHHCSCNFIPRIREYFNMGDLAGLIAPRKLVVVAGKEDKIFPYQGVLESYESIKMIYAAAGAADNHKLATGDGGHRYYAKEAWEAFKELF